MRHETSGRTLLALAASALLASCGFLRNAPTVPGRTYQDLSLLIEDAELARDERAVRHVAEVP